MDQDQPDSGSPGAVPNPWSVYHAPQVPPPAPAPDAPVAGAPTATPPEPDWAGDVPSSGPSAPQPSASLHACRRRTIRRARASGRSRSCPHWSARWSAEASRAASSPWSTVTFDDDRRCRRRWHRRVAAVGGPGQAGRHPGDPRQGRTGGRADRRDVQPQCDRQPVGHRHRIRHRLRRHHRHQRARRERGDRRRGQAAHRDVERRRLGARTPRGRGPDPGPRGHQGRPYGPPHRRSRQLGFVAGRRCRRRDRQRARHRGQPDGHLGHRLRPRPHGAHRRHRDARRRDPDRRRHQPRQLGRPARRRRRARHRHQHRDRRPELGQQHRLRDLDLLGGARARPTCAPGGRRGSRSWV